MSSMNFPNLPLPTSTGNPMSNPMGRNYMSDPNANLSFAKNSGAASGGGGGGGAAPISLEQQIQTLTQECAEYSKANPGGPQDQNCQQRLNQLIQSRNAGTPSSPEPRDTNSGGPSGKDTKAKSYASDTELDEMERLHQMLLVNNSPYQQSQIRQRISDILYKRQQADKRQAAADSHQAYLDRVGRARESFAQSEAARKQNLADRKAQSEGASRRVAAKNAEADASNRGAYATALAEGRISPEEYARLMGDTLGGGSNVTTAPTPFPPTPALDLAKGAPRIDPGSVGFYQKGLSNFKKSTETPTSPFPPAEAPTRSNMGPTTADLYPNGMPSDTPSMTERFGNTAVGQAVGAAGNFIKSFFPEKPDYQPPVENKPATNPSRSFEATLPTTLRQNSPTMSNQGKLRNLQSTYSVYMHNLQNAAERGEISSDEFRSLRDAATKNYYLEQDIIGGAISDAAPAPVSSPTPPRQRGFVAGLDDVGGKVFNLADSGLTAAIDAAAPVVNPAIDSAISGIDSGLSAVGSAFEAADNMKLRGDRAMGSTIASGVDALTSAKDAIQLKTGQAMQALLNELKTGNITLEQFNKLRNMLPDMPPPRMPRAPF
jgi:hypothetical protein